MNRNVESLIIKDLLLFKNYRKTYLFTVAVFTIVLFSRAYYGDVLFTGTLLFMLVFGTNSISTFSYDEMAKAERYLLGLTVTRKEMVRAKYLFSIFVSLSATVIGFLLSALAMVIMKGDAPNMTNYLIFVLYAYMIVSFLIITDVPCIYKWGVEKGRMQAIIIPVIMTLILMAIGMVVYAILNYYATFNKTAVTEFFKTYIIAIPIILTIVMYYTSYRISLRIFKKKDI